MRVPPPVPASLMRGHSTRLKCSNRASGSAGQAEGCSRGSMRWWTVQPPG